MRYLRKKIHALKTEESPFLKSHLQVDNLHKSYKKRTVVQGVSLDIYSGEVVGVLGPNGAGKTTSFSMVSGLVRPDQGRITLDGQDLSFLPMHERAKLGLVYLPQETSIFRGLSTQQNIDLVLEEQKLSRQTRRERREQLIADFNLQHVQKSLSTSLSGGERRRLEIARALALNPKFLLLDEPFAGVDPVSVESIRSMIRELAQQGLGIFITDHSVRETLSVVDRAYIIASGQNIASGKAEEIIHNPEVQRLYLGEGFRL